MKIMMMTVLLATWSDGLTACGKLMGGVADLGRAVTAVQEEERRRALERKVEILEEEQALEAERARVREATARLLEERGPREPPAVAALFGVDPTESFGEGSADAFTDLVFLELVATGRRQLIPLERTRAALIQAQRDAQSPCFDETCRFELGKALAADTVIRPVILPDGFGCIVGLELYDLARETRDWASSVRSGCDADALGKSARELARAMP